jgi:hypothetical protein
VLLLLAVLILGVLVGLAMGGNLRHLSEISFRWWGFAILGLAVQFVPVPSGWGDRGHLVAVGLLILSYVLLTVFVAANIRQAGFPLMAAGFLLNILVIAVNGGMPVSSHALDVAYGSGASGQAAAIRSSGGEKHHLERPDDVLLPLTDVVGIPAPFHTVFSPGDLVSLAAAGWVVAAATAGPGGRHSRRSVAEMERGAIAP